MNQDFAKDFIALQSELQTMPKDKSGYGYKYTDLDTIISNLKPLAKKHNIGFYQLLTTRDGVTGVDTYAVHTSGDSIGSFVAIPEIQVGKANTAQNIGAAITYFKRYSLSALFGISNDEDVDCSTQIMEKNIKQMNAADSKKSPNPKESTTSSDKTPKNSNQKSKFTKEQATELGKLMNTKKLDGSAIFGESEKAKFRAMLMNGEYEKASEEAKKIIQEDIAAEVDGELVDNSALF